MFKVLSIGIIIVLSACGQEKSKKNKNSGSKNPSTKEILACLVNNDFLPAEDLKEIWKKTGGQDPDSDSLLERAFIVGTLSKKTTEQVKNTCLKEPS